MADPEADKLDLMMKAVIEAGDYLDDLADAGDKRANKISKDYPEADTLEKVKAHALLLLTCRHPLSQRAEIRKHLVTACLKCRRLLKSPLP